MASNNNKTELSSLLSTNHGRDRREERGIQKIDLQRARRYGIQESSRKGRLKFTYGGIVFIYDPKRGNEITSFPSRDIASESSGTQVTVPIMLKKNEAYSNPILREKHAIKKGSILDHKDKWTSHAVFVVDMSGSMRRDDVSGGKCRSDAVWMVLARDFVKKQLVDNTATDWDIVSVVVMKGEAEVVIEYAPLDWILYNELIDMREWDICRPSGPGNYLPALERAEALLASNTLGTCALSLVFFSDGKPSDHGPFVEKMGEIASTYRRRLTVCCVGIAQDSDDETFDTLNSMVTEADAFGARSSFHVPSLDTMSLSTIVNSMSSLLSSTKTEMTDLATGETRAVRRDVRSERKGTVDDLSPTDDWRLYGATVISPLYVRRVSSWSVPKDDFVHLRDPRCVFCWKASIDPPLNEWCKNCNVATICHKCAHKSGIHIESDECHRLLKDHRLGKIATLAVSSFSVGIKIPIFGEGAERVVRKFRYLDENSNFIGPTMVAKDSRFEIDTYDSKRAFHANFLRTQALASEIATYFNEALDSLALLPCFEHMPEYVNKLPRIEFLDPMVIDVKEGYERLSFLIEPFMEGKYEKFNNNMGYVEGQEKNEIFEIDHLAVAWDNLRLNAIEEGSDDSDDDDDDDNSDDEIFSPMSHHEPNSHNCSKAIADRLFPQAFSDYSFQRTKENFLVVDLQGVFEKKSDGSRKYVFTDPAIHKSSMRRMHKYDFGRTDRGSKGMRAFFETHTCNDACRLMGLNPVDPRVFDRKRMTTGR